MFWRFGFHNSSAIESIIERGESIKIDDILGEEDLLQEVKAQNRKVLDFICKPENLKGLFSFITDNERLVESKKFKWPFLASEIISCEVEAIIDAIFDRIELLVEFWKFLDRPAPLNPLLATYFAKINIVLLSKRPESMLAFLKAEENSAARITSHLSCHAIAELILKLISVEDTPEGMGALLWIRELGLIDHLFEQMNPTLDSDCHIIAAQTLIDIITLTYQAPPTDPDQSGMTDQVRNPLMNGNNLLIAEMKTKRLLSKLVEFMLNRDAPHCTSSLINGINVLMELIRRYCSEIETVEMHHHDYTIQSQILANPPPYSGMEKVISLSTDLNDVFTVFCDNLKFFAFALDNPKSISGPKDTTLGKETPLGSERLKICELFAEFIHLQYLFTSSPLFDMMAAPLSGTNIQEGSFTVADGLILLTEKFVENNIMERCIKLFFLFPWNNFIHSVVYDMIAKIFNTFSYTSNLQSATLDSSFQSQADDDSQPSALLGASSSKMKQVRVSVKKLVITVFKGASLIDRITDAQRLNDFHVEQPKGLRLGYMGHLTYISDETCKLFEKCAQELETDLGEFMNSEVWNEYVTHALHQTQETDRQPLGGIRPEYSAMHTGPISADDDSAFKPMVSISEQKTTLDFDEKNVQESGETYNDQFARFLCQQLVKDIPDRFLGADSSDEEDEKRWIGDLADEEFDIRDVISKDNLDITPYNIREGDEETVSDDFESITQQDSAEPEQVFPRSGSYSAEESSFSMSEVAGQLPGTEEKVGWVADFSKAEFPSTSSTPSNSSEYTKSFD